MCAHLMTTAFSPVLREWYDFAATISGPRELDFPMAAVSDSLMLFSGTMSEAVRNTAEEFGPDELAPGDVLICNDPVRTGTHPNDILFTRPVFETGDLIGYISIQAHMLDIGGTVPGGFSPNKQTIYENGLVIPPMLMFRGDQPVRSTFSLILDNARFGEIMLPDSSRLPRTCASASDCCSKPSAGTASTHTAAPFATRPTSVQSRCARRSRRSPTASTRART